MSTDAPRPHAASPTIDATHDPKLRSWVESANDPATDFPIQNLPLAAYEASHDNHTHTHLATLIGDEVLDISMLVESGLIGRDKNEEALARAITMPHAFGLLRAPALRRQLREALQRFLREDSMGGQSLRRVRQKALRPRRETRLAEPVAIFNYTDFYASIHHASTVGAMFRPDNPLLPNYKWVPIGYHGRASSIVASGTPIPRPHGQTFKDGEASPTFGPCQMLDYELEVGCIIGPGNPLGRPVSVAEARHLIAGYCLVNDWSARDVQKWEYQPLGPFLAKNFATTISECMVFPEALEPFRCAAYTRPEGDPQPLEYLRDDADTAFGGLDLHLEAQLQTAEMAKRGLSPVTLSTGRTFREMYWTFQQMIAHHTSNGCNLQPGDLLASGTVSGPEPSTRGCLLELTWDGTGKPRRPISLPSGETRTFLQDGDTVILRAWAEREGFRRIGFGECRGTIVG
ncbi:MAG: fumarylacetoacetase [Planctomycetota bacterium]|nr:fumarylacetoacetase [Planctomycetota bacterium]